MNKMRHFQKKTKKTNWDLCLLHHQQTGPPGCSQGLGMGRIFGLLYQEKYMFTQNDLKYQSLLW